MALRSRPPEPKIGGLTLPSYGYMGDIPLYREAVRIPEVDMRRPEPPDLVKIQYGAGDKNIVGALLRVVAGEESGLDVPPPPDYAATLLQSWGYPTSMDALSADEWAARISANAAMNPNPFDLIGGY